jgi:hemerythrin-like domain-containing protein
VCDYCDCRSHPQLASLSADHDALLDLVVGLRLALDDEPDGASRARPLLAELRDLLRVHSDREERGVFRQLRAAQVDDSYVVSYETDHARLHELLDDIANDDWRVASLDLVAILEDHITREESDLFPAAHQLLSPSQWDAVDAALTPTYGAVP